MKRSAQPLPSGSRTKVGELWIPKNRSSFWNTLERSAPPWSWRSHRPWRSPQPTRDRVRECLGGSLRDLQTVAVPGNVDPNAFGCGMLHWEFAPSDESDAAPVSRKRNRWGPESTPDLLRLPRSAYILPPPTHPLSPISVTQLRFPQSPSMATAAKPVLPTAKLLDCSFGLCGHRYASRAPEQADTGTPFRQRKASGLMGAPQTKVARVKEAGMATEAQNLDFEIHPHP